MYGLDDLVTALSLRVETGWGSVIAGVLQHANEVEQAAAYLRQNLPYEAAVFVHYFNLDPALRRDVEDGFAERVWPSASPARPWSRASTSAASTTSFWLARLRA